MDLKNQDFQIGDKIVSIDKDLRIAIGEVMGFYSWPTSTPVKIHCGSCSYQGQAYGAENQNIFHKEAVTIDKYGRLTAINHDYVKDRTPNAHERLPATNHGYVEPRESIVTKEPHEFVPFEKVLVRGCKGHAWRCDLFSHYDRGYAGLSLTWQHCIPYEGNEHLVGKIQENIMQLRNQDFQIGDKIVFISFGLPPVVGEVTDLYTCCSTPVKTTCGTCTYQGQMEGPCAYYGQQAYGKERQRIFHKEAVTIDEHGRLTAINHYYVKDRTPNEHERLPAINHGDVKQHEFVPFERVLGRDHEGDSWHCDLFSHYYEEYDMFACVSSTWDYCIPYEGNEHLVGKITSIDDVVGGKDE